MRYISIRTPVHVEEWCLGVGCGLGGMYIQYVEYIQMEGRKEDAEMESRSYECRAKARDIRILYCVYLLTDLRNSYLSWEEERQEKYDEKKISGLWWIGIWEILILRHFSTVSATDVASVSCLPSHSWASHSLRWITARFDKGKNWPFKLSHKVSDSLNLYQSYLKCSKM